MPKYRENEIVKAKVTGITDYGFFVSLDENDSGLVHISEISHDFVRNVNDFVNIGETIYVEILDTNNENRLRLSIKNINYRIIFNIDCKSKIKETLRGFHTLSYKLPFWIDESLKKQQKSVNSIDKIGIK